MIFSKYFVDYACSILLQVNPLAKDILTEVSDTQVGVMFRNCVVTVITDLDGNCHMVYTDIQFMEDAQRDLFFQEAQDLPGVFILELEQEFTRIGFK